MKIKLIGIKNFIKPKRFIEDRNVSFELVSKVFENKKEKKIIGIKKIDVADMETKKHIVM